MTKRILTSICLLLFVLPAQAEDVEQLILQLGDRRFQVRERAMNKLRQLGSKATPALLKHVDQADREIRWRVHDLLSERGWLPATLREEVEELLQTIRSAGGVSPDQVWRQHARRMPILEKRNQALRRLFELGAPVSVVLKRFLAPTGGKVELKLGPEKTVSPGQTLTVKAQLRNVGRGGLWMRRGVPRIGMRWTPFQRSYQFSGASGPIGRFGGRFVMGGTRIWSPLREYAYVAPGAAVPIKPLERKAPGYFGRMRFEVALEPIKKVVWVSGPHRTRKSELKVWGKKEQASQDVLVLPAFDGKTDRGLRLRLSGPKEAGRQVPVRLTLHNTGAQDCYVWDLEKAGRAPLWYALIDLKGRLVERGYVSDGEALTQIDVRSGPQKLKLLTSGAQLSLPLKIRLKAPAGRYRLGLGYGAISKRETPLAIWTGSLASNTITIQLRR